MKGIDKNSFQPIANRTRSRCRDVSQSFDLSETITEKYEDITEKIEEFKKDVSQSFQEFTKEWSGTMSQAPKWQRQEYILRGYRVGLSMKETFLSMFVLHNETVNVWTHLIGSLYFLYALIVFGPVPASYISSNSNGIINNSDYENVLATWPITIYIISATMCMALSTIFHLLLNYNYQMNKFVSSLDYAGISLLIAGSFFPVLEYGFCNNNTRKIYLFGLSILTLFTVSFALYDWENKVFHGNKSKWYRFRNFSFAAQGCYGVVPFTHQVVNHMMGYNPMYLMSFVWVLIMGAFYLGGLTILMTKFPECLTSSGKFDYILSSHQIWHVCVFIAALIWLYCVRTLYAWRIDNVCTMHASGTWGL